MTKDDDTCAASLRLGTPAEHQQCRNIALVPPLRFSVVSLSSCTSSSSSSSQEAAAASAVPPNTPQSHQLPPSAGPAPSLSQALYRGSHPKPRNLPFLRRLRLRSILSLTPKPLASSGPSKEAAAAIVSWAESSSCRLEWVECEKGKEKEVTLDKESADRAIAVSVHQR